MDALAPSQFKELIHLLGPVPVTLLIVWALWLKFGKKEVKRLTGQEQATVTSSSTAAVVELSNQVVKMSGELHHFGATMREQHNATLRELTETKLQVARLRSAMIRHGIEEAGE